MWEGTAPEDTRVEAVKERIELETGGRIYVRPNTT